MNSSHGDLFGNQAEDWSVWNSGPGAVNVIQAPTQSGGSPNVQGLFPGPGGAYDSICETGADPSYMQGE